MPILRQSAVRRAEIIAGSREVVKRKNRLDIAIFCCYPRKGGRAGRDACFWNKTGTPIGAEIIAGFRALVKRKNKKMRRTVRRKNSAIVFFSLAA